MCTPPLTKPQFERRFKCGCVSHCTCHDEMVERWQIRATASEMKVIFEALSAVWGAGAHRKEVSRGFSGNIKTARKEIRDSEDALVLAVLNNSSAISKAMTKIECAKRVKKI